MHNHDKARDTHHKLEHINLRRLVDHQPLDIILSSLRLETRARMEILLTGNIAANEAPNTEPYLLGPSVFSPT